MGLAVSVGWASGGQAGGAVAACSPHSCSPCENREVTPDGHTCPIDFEAAETVDYKSSLSKAPLNAAQNGTQRERMSRFWTVGLA